MEEENCNIIDEWHKNRGMFKEYTIYDKNISSHLSDHTKMINCPICGRKLQVQADE